MILPYYNGDIQKIFAEQSTAVARLLAISPKIKIIFRYVHVMNGLYVIGPQQYAELISKSFARSTSVTVINGPSLDEIGDESTAIFKRSSVNFLGDTSGRFGRGTRVGVIDTGIDYTHRMFNNSSTESDLKYGTNGPNIIE